MVDCGIRAVDQDLSSSHDDSAMNKIWVLMGLLSAGLNGVCKRRYQFYRCGFLIATNTTGNRLFIVAHKFERWPLAAMPPGFV